MTLILHPRRTMKRIKRNGASPLSVIDPVKSVELAGVQSCYGIGAATKGQREQIGFGARYNFLFRSWPHIRTVLIWSFTIYLAAHIALAIEKPGNPFNLAVRDLMAVMK